MVRARWARHCAALQRPGSGGCSSASTFADAHSSSARLVAACKAARISSISAGMAAFVGMHPFKRKANPKVVNKLRAEPLAADGGAFLADDNGISRGRAEIEKQLSFAKRAAADDRFDVNERGAIGAKESLVVEGGLDFSERLIEQVP